MSIPPKLLPGLMYHGGPAGLSRIIPPSKSGAQGTAKFGGVGNPDRVYVTPDYAAALLYAAATPAPRVYVVRPVGALEHDPDCLDVGLSYECESAEVVRAIRPPRKQIARARKALVS